MYLIELYSRLLSTVGTVLTGGTVRDAIYANQTQCRTSGRTFRDSTQTEARNESHNREFRETTNTELSQTGDLITSH